jgi:hypothetical protein
MTGHYPGNKLIGLNPRGGAGPQWGPVSLLSSTRDDHPKKGCQSNPKEQGTPKRTFSPRISHRITEVIRFTAQNLG